MRFVPAERLTELLSAHPHHQPRVVVGGNAGTPVDALAAVDAALPAYRLFMLNARCPVPVRPGVVLETPFVGPAMRDQPGLEYVPARLSLVPQLLRTARPPDVVVVQTTPPRHGLVSLGIEVNVLPAAIESARARGGLVVAQVNPRLPFTYGDAELSVADIDLAIEADRPLPELIPGSGADEATVLIGKQVAALVPPGASLQTGIGAVPDATLAALGGHRGLRVWTEMFSDGVLALDRAGALDPDARLATSFVMGSAELYGWLDGNPRVQLLRTERTNDPAVIARQPAMTSINTALQVDLYAQANATRVGRRIYSGIGGQCDFVSGALHAPGGRAVIALASWHPKAGVSTIVPHLTAPATSFQHSEVVTEHGVAQLWGADHRTQARRLIDVADPRARGGLVAAAERLGLLG